MIKNEREYRITKAQAKKFEHALSELVASGGDSRLDPLLQKAEREAVQSQLEDLQEQISEYEALRSGKRTVISLDSLEELPQALIQARIASGLTQRELAEKLGLKEQQIQRYEATEYASADLARLSEIARALKIRVREDVLLEDSQQTSGELLARLRNLVQETVATYKKAV